MLCYARQQYDRRQLTISFEEFHLNFVHKVIVSHWCLNSYPIGGWWGAHGLGCWASAFNTPLIGSWESRRICYAFCCTGEDISRWLMGEYILTWPFYKYIYKKKIWVELTVSELKTVITPLKYYRILSQTVIWPSQLYSHN